MTTKPEAALSAAQRRAYIDTKRRTQPLSELRRKAIKANRKGWKRTYAGVEGKDLTFAEHWRWHLKGHAHSVALFRLTFCSLCCTFAPVGEPVHHKTRCAANPIDDGPYPGWTEAGRATLEGHDE